MDKIEHNLAVLNSPLVAAECVLNDRIETFGPKHPKEPEKAKKPEKTKEKPCKKQQVNAELDRLRREWLTGKN